MRTWGGLLSRTKNRCKATDFYISGIKARYSQATARIDGELLQVTNGKTNTPGYIAWDDPRLAVPGTTLLLSTLSGSVELPYDPAHAHGRPGRRDFDVSVLSQHFTSDQLSSILSLSISNFGDAVPNTYHNTIVVEFLARASPAAIAEHIIRGDLLRHYAGVRYIALQLQSDPAAYAAVFASIDTKLNFYPALGVAMLELNAPLLTNPQAITAFARVLGQAPGTTGQIIAGEPYNPDQDFLSLAQRFATNAPRAAITSFIDTVKARTLLASPEELLVLNQALSEVGATLLGSPKPATISVTAARAAAKRLLSSTNPHDIAYFAGLTRQHFGASPTASNFTHFATPQDALASCALSRGSLDGDDRDKLISLGADPSAFADPSVCRYLFFPARGHLGIVSMDNLPADATLELVQEKPGTPLSLVLTGTRINGTEFRATRPEVNFATAIVGTDDKLWTIHPGLPSPSSNEPSFEDAGFIAGQVITIAALRDPDSPEGLALRQRFTYANVDFPNIHHVKIPAATPNPNPNPNPNPGVELADILTRMNIPAHRAYDYAWLDRNLGINNSTSPEFPRASELLMNLIRQANH
jgi:hypothetical protein